MATRVDLVNLHERSINTSTREVWLHPNLDSELEDVEINYKAAVQFEKNINFLERQSDRPILVHSHACGGEWDDGMAIYDTIKLSRCFVTILVYAHARSMSGIILQAADRRIMMPNAYFLAHYGFLAYDDREVPAINFAKDAEQCSRQMLHIFAEKMKKSRKFRHMKVDDVIKFIDRQLKDLTDWKLNAEDTVSCGLADGVFGKGKYKTLASLLK